MFTFPDSLISSLFQYPTSRRISFATQVLSFVGGSEQRYELAGSGLRQWNAQPTLLPQVVTDQLAAFFQLVGGSTSSFEFRDPWEDVTYPVCYFKEAVLEITMKEPGRNAVQFTIVEGSNQP